MASLQEEYSDRISFYFVEATQAPAATVMEAFKIRQHPAVFILNRRGDLVGRFTGVVERDELTTRMEAALN